MCTKAHVDQRIGELRGIVTSELEPGKDQARGRGHELGEPDRARPADHRGIERALLSGERVEEPGIDLLLGGRVLDLLLEWTRVRRPPYRQRATSGKDRQGRLRTRSQYELRLAVLADRIVGERERHHRGLVHRLLPEEADLERGVRFEAGD